LPPKVVRSEVLLKATDIFEYEDSSGTISAGVPASKVDVVGEQEVEEDVEVEEEEEEEETEEEEEETEEEEEELDDEEEEDVVVLDDLLLPDELA
jgi:hypothetical protein